MANENSTSNLECVKILPKSKNRHPPIQSSNQTMSMPIKYFKKFLSFFKHIKDTEPLNLKSSNFVILDSEQYSLKKSSDKFVVRIPLKARPKNDSDEDFFKSVKIGTDKPTPISPSDSEDSDSEPEDEKRDASRYARICYR
jgi:hypothetical protein